MTREQAEAEFSRLCAELGVNTRSLSGPQVGAWIRKLTEMSYEWGRASVTRVVETWDRQGVPPVGFLTRCSEEIMREGVPNAGAYSQDLPSPRRTPAQMETEHFLVWRQQQIVALGDDQYWEYLHNKPARRRLDQAWREEWAGQTAVMAQ